MLLELRVAYQRMRMALCHAQKQLRSTNNQTKCGAQYSMDKKAPRTRCLVEVHAAARSQLLTAEKLNSAVVSPEFQELGINGAQK